MRIRAFDIENFKGTRQTTVSGRRLRHTSVLPLDLIWRLAVSRWTSGTYGPRLSSDSPYDRLQRVTVALVLDHSERKTARAILQSRLFSPRFYLADHPDLAQRAVDPLRHFLTRGIREGRKPNPLFDPTFYLETHRDVALAGVNPLLHYIVYGSCERRRPHWMFDPAYYLEQNPEVETIGMDPLIHYLEIGALKGCMPMELDEASIDPIVNDLHRLDLADPNNFSFEPDIYRLLHSDLASMPAADLREHYERTGHAEGRPASRGEFVQMICGDPRAIPLDFSAENYFGFYRDLDHLRAEGLYGALRHYMQFGRFEGRFYTTDTDLSVSMLADLQEPEFDIAPLGIGSEIKLCVLVHAFHTDIWRELAGYIKNLRDVPHDLYVNLVDSSWTEDVLSEIRIDFPEARVYISENIGRDIGGFVSLMQNIDMKKYEVFCLLHTKKSPHVGDLLARKWRTELLSAILESPSIASKNVALMLTDEAVGQIGSLRWRNTHVHRNEKKYLELLDTLGVRESARDCEYLSGTMMLVRRHVLERIFLVLRDVAFEVGDDKPLEFHIDGQIAHAVERIIGNVVRDMNYQFIWR